MTHSLIQYFDYAHLPPELGYVSKQFHDLAVEMDKLLQPGDMKTAMIYRLLEAKDCAVRQFKTDLDNKVRDERIEEVKEALYPQGIPSPRQFL